MKMNVVILFLLSVVACQGNGENYSSGPAYEKMAIEATSEGEIAGDLVSPPVSEQPAPDAEQVERKLIKEGSMRFQCDDVLKTKVDVDRIIGQLGAYTSNEGKDSYGDNLNYRQTIRVPADKFDTLVSELEKLAVKVEHKDINTRDVTEEFIDLETRLKTKKELELRYLEILKQARKVEEVLSVEREIGNVRGEIESMEGRLNYIKNLVSFSTLNLSYYQYIETDFGFGSKLVRSFGNGWKNLLSFVIGVMSLWPFVLLCAGGVWLLIRRRRRKV